MMQEPAPPAFKRRLSLKITAPYLFLSLILGLAAIYLVARMEADAVSDAFSRQLNDGGTRVADSVVRQEREHLTSVRAIANLEGVGEALQRDDQAALDALIFPYVVNQQIDRVVVLDNQGRGRWASQHGDAGVADYRFDLSGDYAGWPFVAAVLQGQQDSGGDKFIGLGLENNAWVLYTVGPVFQDSQQVGAVMVGTSLTRLAQRWRESTLADITIYDHAGVPLVTSLGPDLPQAADAATDGAFAPIRALELGSRSYREVLGPLRVRQNTVLGILGVALPISGAESRGNQAAIGLLVLFAIGSLAIVATGMVLTRWIVKPINALVGASGAIAAGDLSRHLTVDRGDELGELTHTYNQMVAGLRERERIRDLLGRFVSPTIANLILQRPLDLSGELRLLTILFSDIHNFTTMSEERDPTEVVQTLNQYFRIVVQAAERHDGLVNKFGGDSTLVLFGLTDTGDNGQRGARAALAAALDVRAGMVALNIEREQQGQPPIYASIGINTGHAVAGLVGAEQRMEYTVIGDAVNLSARIQALSRDLGGDILISADTYEALGSDTPIQVGDLGQHTIKGKQHKVHIFSVLEEAIHAAPDL